MNYLNEAIAFVIAHLKQVLAIIGALVLLREFRAVLLIAAVVALVYWLVPGVRSDWSMSFQFFLSGVRQLF